MSIFIYGYPFDPCKQAWLTAADLLKKYAVDKLNFIEEIEGVYSLMLIDLTVEKCFIVTDRYGIYTLLCYHDREHFWLADKLGGDRRQAGDR